MCMQCMGKKLVNLCREFRNATSALYHFQKCFTFIVLIFFLQALLLLLLNSYCIYSDLVIVCVRVCVDLFNFIMLLLTVFAGTPCQKGQHINTSTRCYSVAVFFPYGWSRPCCISKWLILFCLNTYISFYGWENVIARSTTRCLCVPFFLLEYAIKDFAFFLFIQQNLHEIVAGCPDLKRHLLCCLFLYIFFEHPLAIFISRSHSHSLYLGVLNSHSNIFSSGVSIFCVRYLSVKILFLSQKIKRSLLFMCTCWSYPDRRRNRELWKYSI